MGRRKTKWERAAARARRVLGGRLLRALDADERTAALFFMPEDMCAMLATLDADEARAAIRDFMRGMAGRGYSMDGVSRYFGGGDEE